MINHKGFSLIELMIAMVVSSLIVTAVYAVHSSQQQTYQVQEQVAEMQQNLRSALYFMTYEIRMAGYDPQGSGNFGITSALTGRLQLTVDDNEDGIMDNEEKIDIGFTDAATSVNRDVDGNGIPDLDSNGDGVPDAVNIGKQTYSAANNPSGYQSFAENIQAVEFQYLDSTGAITAVINDILSIQLTILARARRSDPKFINSMTYTTPSGTDTSGNPVAGQTWGPYNDNFRRRMATTTIRCRNLGI